MAPSQLLAQEKKKTPINTAQKVAINSHDRKGSRGALCISAITRHGDACKK